MPDSAARHAPAEPPKLEYEELLCTTGYGPRPVGLASDGSLAFVGCKDGTVQVVERPYVSDSRPSFVSRRHGAGIKALLHVDGTWLLIGDDDGRLYWGRGGAEGLIEASEDTGGDRSSVTCIVWLDAERREILVARRRAEAALYSWEPDGEGPPKLRRREMAVSGGDRLLAAVTLARTDAKTWIAVSESCDLTRWTRSSDTSFEAGRVPWPDDERPGFMTDTAVLGGEGGASQELFLSTSDGIFHLSAGADPAPERVRLPGVSDLCMTLTPAESAEYRYLWVADSTETLYLFWTRAGGVSRLWRPQVVHRASTEVLKASAVFHRDSETLLLAQTCRGDSLRIHRVRETNGRSSETPGRAGIARSENLSVVLDGDVRRLAARRKECMEDLLGDDVCGLPPCTDPAAHFADLLDWLGEDVQAMREFLVHPASKLAVRVLGRLRRRGEAALREAITLWTHTLLGVVHRRFPPPAQREYLGIVRWIQWLEGRVAAERWSVSHKEAVRATLREGILLTRKWGLQGETFQRYADSAGARKALAALSRQREHRQHELDYLVYDALPFLRQMDVEAEYPNAPLKGQTAWDVGFVHHGGRSFAAVSWIRGDIELYELVFREIEGLELRPIDPKTLKKTDDVEAKRRRLRHEPPGDYSRALHLGEVGGKLYLLSAPRRNGQTVPCVRLLWLDEKRRVEQRRVRPPDAATGPSVRDGSDLESVYSFLELEPGWVLMGMRGVAGRPRLAMARVDSRKKPAILWPESDDREVHSFPAACPESHSRTKNPIWALARDEQSPRRGGEHVVAVGCGDGRVFRVTISLDEKRRRRGRFGIGRPELVGQLGESVRCVAYRESSGGCRIFAGGTDGTLVCWQSLQAREGDGEAESELVDRFAVLWATREAGGGIAEIYTLRPRAEDGDLAGVDLVFVLTRKGRAVVVYDGDTIGDRESEGAWAGKILDGKQPAGLGGVPSPYPRRELIPGQRMGRIRVHESVFASTWIVGRERGRPSASERAPLARLLLATGDGRLRAVEIHDLHHTESRHRHFEKINRQWRDHLSNGEGFRSHLLRQTEATVAACPEIPRLAVRWALPTNPCARPWEERNPGASLHYLPFHLRCLVLFEKAWLDPSPESTSRIGATLRKSLHLARELEDASTFSEIVTVVLTRANRQVVLADDVNGPFIERYSSILDTLEEMSSAWYGTGDHLDLRIRMLVAKNLVDGTVLRRVSDWAHDGKLDTPDGTLSRFLELRLKLIEQLLSIDDSLLALETLRASNLALVRTCRGIARPKLEGSDWRPIGREHDREREHDPAEVHWHVLRGYFRVLADFTRRMVHAQEGGLGVDLTHEVSRAYALGMLACPSAVIHLVHSMFAAELSHELVRQTGFGQLPLLERTTKCYMPERARRLVDIESSLKPEPGRRANVLRYIDQEVGSESKAKGKLDQAELEKCIGRRNAELVAAYRPFGEILEWLQDLEHELTFRAHDLSLHLRRIRSQREDVRRLKECPDADWRHFEHSFHFWSSALDRLTATMNSRNYLSWNATGPMRAPFDSEAARKPRSLVLPRPIQPGVVLFSRELAEWCKDTRRDLDRRKANYECYDPHYSRYLDALTSVENAARQFRTGASVQKNIFLSVLGHGLIELLGEHLLELWEIAQALDPLATWERDNSANDSEEGNRPAAVADDFAYYLLTGARQAESIPKNLRALQGLFSISIQDNSATCTLGHLFQEFGTAEHSADGDHRWRLEDLERWEDRPIGDGEYQFLRLMLSELDQNDRFHGLASRSPEHRPRVRLKETNGDRFELELVFFYARKDHARVMQVARQELQAMVTARRDRKYPSHGSGLYLANLAAASVGWKLSFSDVEEPGVLTFLLENSDLEEPRRTAS